MAALQGYDESVFFSLASFVSDGLLARSSLYARRSS
jgi:hypothetical protein